MALGINTNVVSLNAQKNLAKSQDALGTSLQRLSSGLRINNASDDAAGMAIADRMTSQIRGSTQAIRNANDGVSLTQTAEGALQQSTDILQRVRELSVQSSNATNSASDRLSIQSEVNQLVSQLDEIAQNTSFNGIKLLDGSFSAQQFQIGADAGQTLSVNVADAKASSLGINSLTVNNNSAGASVATTANSVSMSASLFNTTASSGTLGTAFATSASGAVKAQTITIKNGSNPATTVALAAATGSGVNMNDGDASVIAAKLNAVTGVHATAINKVSIDTLGLLGGQSGDQVRFDLFVGDGQTGSTVNFIVDTNDNSEGNLDAAIQAAVNDINAKTGTADLSYNTTSNELVSAAGRNIGINTFDKIDTAGGVLTIDTLDTTDTMKGMTITMGGAVLTTNAADDVSTIDKLVTALKASTTTVSATGTFADNGNNTYTLTDTATGESLVLTHNKVNKTLSYQQYTGNTALTAVDVSFALASSTGTTATQGLNNIANTGSGTLASDVKSYTGNLSTVVSGDVTAATASGSTIKFGTDTVTDGSVEAANSNVAAADTAFQMGSVSIFLDEGITIRSNLGGGATTSGIFNMTAATAAASGNSTTIAGGYGDIAQGNNVNAQQLTINGTGTATVNILKNDSIDNVVSLINKSSDTTGVVAKGTTTATLNGFTSAGEVGFTLNGQTVSATITTTDLTSLSSAINNETSKTGVTAALSADKTGLTLTNSTGADISILDYTNSGTGTVSVTGAGNFVNLTQGTGDSTVVGGTIEFTSNVGNFQVSSNLSEAAGSLFATNASNLNGSTRTTVDQIDVTTVAGAQAAISAVDGALAAIDANRADLGAIQNRFTKTVANLTTTVENLSASRSRIQDTDFAAETAQLTKNQIMQQAGTAMLAQANQLPQSVLSLLQ